MFDMKLGGAAAAAAFLLSFVVGLVSGATFLTMLLRATVFAAVFFGLGVGSQILLSRFLPELFGASGGSLEGGDPETGSRVDLVVGDEEAPPAGAAEPPVRARLRNADEEAEEAEEIEAFIPPQGEAGAAAPGGEGAALDQGSEGGYTERRNTNGSPGVLGGSGAEPALPPGLLDDVDVLPDLESMSDSFVSPLVEEAAERSSIESVHSRSSSMPSSSETGGDFDPREMAQAIQTILKRDQKG